MDKDEIIKVTEKELLSHFENNNMYETKAKLKFLEFAKTNNWITESKLDKARNFCKELENGLVNKHTMKEIENYYELAITELQEKLNAK